MSLRQTRLTITTATDGTATVIGDTIQGRLIEVAYGKGTFVAGVDVTISITGSIYAQTLLTLTDANNDAVYYPRVQACDNTGTAINGAYTDVAVIGQIKIEVADGGSKKTGTVDIVWDDCR